MTRYSGLYETRMNFIPDERIQEVLADFLSPEAAERLEMTHRAIGFRSVMGYVNNGSVPDIALRSFKELADGVNVRFYPQLAAVESPLSDSTGRLVRGVSVGIAADLRSETDILEGARRLGFANDDGLVGAGLHIETEDLVLPELLEERWAILKRIIESDRLKSGLYIKFRDEPLTE